MPETDIHSLAEQVGALLKKQGVMLTAAESCTGGGVCHAVTEIAGSSAWFDRGFVTYSNAAKHDLLDVPEAVLAEHGAVSAETVRAMAAGALRHSLADCAVAISGIAGPTGAMPGKPVGTVWFAWQRRGGACLTCLEHFDGDRRSVREQSVIRALQGVLALYGTA